MGVELIHWEDGRVYLMTFGVQCNDDEMADVRSAEAGRWKNEGAEERYRRHAMPAPERHYEVVNGFRSNLTDGTSSTLGLDGAADDAAVAGKSRDRKD